MDREIVHEESLIYIVPIYYSLFGIRGKQSENEVELFGRMLKVVITPHDRVTLTFFQFRVAAVRLLRSFIFQRIMAVAYFHRACTIDEEEEARIEEHERNHPSS